ncbi:aminotransferase class I/II-fold pyridoxal phosphate-dependent enzyme [Kyrpidia sp.]|uniref:aminotransferase class I/II-fold pyridoxal phosphate-dependent enzyme n=1 Tax=Kyrpidia sp. TaxID=2073077 RepID=UPI00258C40BC|nr:aminotransferase class I/II-fold pyridoxal phosphate-dependent enzyme [Kyrpidia sp.]MCL6577358.1 aminotransferase class I/II-fold pyridoxal phosphate-dependent enzyme [Kyrpidia sp.]
MTDFEDRLSPTVRAIPPSGIRRFFDLAATTQGVISLGVGEPDFVTPWRVRDACVDALERGYTSYTSNRGLPALRRAVARYLEDRFRVSYNPDTEVLVTVGASEGIDAALRAILSPGDEVLIPEPSYVSYGPCVQLAGGTPVYVPTRAEDQFKLKASTIERFITPRTKALLLSYPNNPTGATLGERDLEQIRAMVLKHDLLVISDEIYAELSYVLPHTSFPSLPGVRERTMLLTGMSKAYAMTGWRVGFATGPKAWIDAMVKIHQYTILCAPIMSQMAAVEALTKASRERDEMVAQYEERRRLVVSAFRRMGLSCHEPEGAFYAFPSVKETGLDDEVFAEELLKREKVAVVPGRVFGPGGVGHIRCSYATGVDQLLEAFERMERFLEKLDDIRAEREGRAPSSLGGARR